MSSMLYLALEACGVRDDDADHAASHIGRAASIATVVRALPVHARLGQRYIPDDVLAKHGLRHRDVVVSRQDVGRGATDAAAGGGGRARLRSGAQLGLEDLAKEREELRRTAAARIAAAAASAAGGHVHDAACGARREGVPPASRVLRVGDPAAVRPAPDTDGSARAPLSTAAAAPGGATAPTPLLLLAPDELTAPKLRDAVFDLACVARSHVEHARQLAPLLPPGAAAALLPAVPVWRFLTRLEAQQFDVCTAAARTGVWTDGRALSRVYLQLDLLRHVVKGTY